MVVTCLAASYPLGLLEFSGSGDVPEAGCCQELKLLIPGWCRRGGENIGGPVGTCSAAIHESSRESIGGPVGTRRLVGYLFTEGSV